MTRLPLGFELNEGQFDSRVLYAARAQGGMLFLTRDGLTLSLADIEQESPPRSGDPRARLHRRQTLRSVTSFRLAFDGANPAPAVESSGQQPGIKNYFIGNDPTKWHTHVPLFGAITYRDLYPGIDLVFHGNDEGQLEYDFNVAPGADPDRIGFRFDGADATTIDRGDLLIHGASAEVRQLLPHVFASTAGSQPRERAAMYRIDAQGFVRVSVVDREPGESLRIDPVLVYSTYLGGSGGGDTLLGLAVDAQGSAFVTGRVTSIGFPTTQEVFQTANPQSIANLGYGCSVVSKLDPAGSSLIYSTYLGGASPGGGGGQWPLAILVVDGGFAYIGGQTDAPDFPVTDGGAQTIYGGGAEDGFITELGPDGASLIYSTFFGGPADDLPYALGLDNEGNAYLAGQTDNPGLPIVNALQPVFPEAPNVYTSFFAKLSADGSKVLYSSYFGGSGPAGGYTDQLVAIIPDANQQPLLVGFTNSGDLPGHASSPVPFQGGGGDIYLTRLLKDGQTQIFFTYLGGNGLDFPWGLAFDPLGNMLLVGHTGSGDFPVTDGGFQTKLVNSPCTGPSNGQPDGPYDGFIALLNPDGGVLYATYLGGSGDDRLLSVALDAQNHAHILGYTTSSDLHSKDPLRGEHDESLPEHVVDGGDLLLADFTVDGGIDFLSYLGGSADEDTGNWAFSTNALDSNGATYVAATSASDDFPTTSHAYQKMRRGPEGSPNFVIAKYRPTPPSCTLIGLMPNYGASGASVQAQGTNMSGQSELDFGGVASLILFSSANQLQVNATSPTCGPVDVTLNCPGSPPSVLPDGFTFVGCPDSGPPDAGPETDGGPDHASSGSSCGCGSTSTPLDASWILGASLLAMVPRRRQRRNP
jgi:MYXO-CTERM domain-containing protein